VKIPIYQVDAFASEQFRGNPAAICTLDHWLPAHTMQAIAAENNLAETAFTVREGARWGLRWFTPAVEVDLCGHATLAAAYVLWNYRGAAEDVIVFESRSGELTVAREDGLLWLNFPSRPAERTSAPPRLSEGLGAHPLEVFKAASYLMAVFPAEEDVRSLQPSFDLLASHEPVICTAPGAEAEIDFVSRFFAPSFGIDEDPVTGSAHCSLTPYWSRRLGKKSLRARQISQRTGELWLEDRDDRVRIGGHVAPYLAGTITACQPGIAALA
jgi:PhzF family phenazine biosynthesis protein